MQRIVKDKRIGSRFGSYEAKWKIGAVFKSIDWFGREIPSFNLKGETKIPTLFGGLITFSIMILSLSYALFKGVILLKRSNPTISSYPMPYHFEISETVNLNEIGFRFAFSFKNSKSHALIDDPHYVKWIVRKTGKRNGTDFEEILPFHKCTDADYAEFYPIAKNSQQAIKDIRKDPKKGLFCLDEWTDDLSIGGDEDTPEWSRL